MHFEWGYRLFLFIRFFLVFISQWGIYLHFSVFIIDPFLRAIIISSPKSFIAKSQKLKSGKIKI